MLKWMFPMLISPLPWGHCSLLHLYLLNRGQEQSLKTISVRHNPESQNRWQFSEE